MDIKQLSSWFDSNEARIMERWKTLLKFKSISADESYAAECGSCAEWLKGELVGMGLNAKLIPTESKPMVYGEWKGEPGRPTILFYGHYDVQPPDPLDKWQSPPFEPFIRERKMFARGASDNKGQVTFVLSAIEAAIKSNSLKCNLKVLIEGEEESGSHGMDQKLPELADMVKADVLFVSDSSMVPWEAPTITMGLRGLMSLGVHLEAYPSDVHSGLFGGAIKNPLTELARLVGSFHDNSGKVAVPGFYDDLTPHSKMEAELCQTGKTPDEEYLKTMGTLPTGGESNYSAAERVGFRPTLEVNGLHGGYGGPGGKTIIPREGVLKLTTRLGTGQSPERMRKLLQDYIRAKLPQNMKVTFEGEGHGGVALRLDPESPWLTKVKEALGDISEKEIAFRWEGGSIPVLTKLQQVSGATPILVAFGKAEDNWHAPNEALSLDRFKMGFLFTARYLTSL
jgi:acetylornithine deacetylase/succinyl-diaminopimelate desuccinylase-like protein